MSKLSPKPIPRPALRQKRVIAYNKPDHKSAAAHKNAGPTEERRKPFTFRHFVVYQDRCAMKVGTDAMLLGSWAAPPEPSPRAGARCRILDVGTGTGVLALMMAQKTAATASTVTDLTTTDSTAASAPATAGVSTAATTSAASGAATSASVADAAGAAAPAGRNPDAIGATPTHGCGGGDSGNDARIVAIDVDADACSQAAENAVHSPWSDRIRVLHCSLQQLAAAAAATAEPATAAAAMTERVGTGGAVAGSCCGDDSDTSAAAGAAAACGVGAASASGVTSFAAEDLGPFDLIITNPPYFLESSKPAPGRTARASARHADVALPYSDLAAGCEALLAAGGSVRVVLPPTEAQTFCEAASACGLVLVELLRVFTAPEDARERRHLMRLRRASELSYTDAETTPELPYISTLVINGPKKRLQDGRRNEGAAAAAAATAATPDAATPVRRSGDLTSAARHYTTAYMDLTADFHPPAVFLRHRLAADDADANADAAAAAAADRTPAAAAGPTA